MIDIEQEDQLIPYLRREGHLRPDEPARARRLSGGVSSRTVWVERADGDWVLKQSLDKLRVAVDWFSDPKRIHCEASALRWLTRLTPSGTIPDFVFEDFENHILAMRAVPMPHENWKVRLLAGGLDVCHVEAFGRLLATIQRGSSARMDEIAPDFASCTFFESLRIEPYYRYTAAQVPAARAFIDTLIADMLPLRLSLVHGDFSPKNVLIYADKLVLLDHEVAHIGDPAFDLGFSTTHLLSKANHLPDQREAFADAAARYWDAYSETLGDVSWRGGLEARAVRHTLACMLARVSGRSPLEYLSVEAKDRQRVAVVALMADAPTTYHDLTARYTANLTP